MLAWLTVPSAATTRQGRGVIRALLCSPLAVTCQLLRPSRAHAAAAQCMALSPGAVSPGWAAAAACGAAAGAGTAPPPSTEATKSATTLPYSLVALFRAAMLAVVTAAPCRRAQAGTGRQPGGVICLCKVKVPRCSATLLLQGSG